MHPSSDQGPGLLAQLPAFDSEGNVAVVIETPKGSPNKYAYDPDCAAFRLKGVLPEGTMFPFDFGFIPSTRGQDGDPLDVLVFLDSPTPVGCLIDSRLIGVIEVRQREAEAEWEQNDRFLAVACHSRAQAHVRSLDDLRPGLLDEIEAFFQHYTRLHGRELEIVGRGGPERARERVAAGLADVGPSS